MENNVEVKISYNVKEIKKAVSFFIMCVNKMNLYFMIIYPILIAVMLLTFIFYDTILSILFFIGGYAFFYIYYIMPINRYINFYQKRKGGVYCFSKDRVLIIGEEFQSTCSWTMFKKAFEIPSAFLLMDDNRFIYIFPKSCFNNESDIKQLSEILTKNVSNFQSYN